MKLKHLVPALLALAAFALAAPAAPAGGTLPTVELEGFAQTKAKSFGDFAGRAVLIEFFAYWCGPCGASVPHLNELAARYGDRGLSILGVTGEGKKDTQSWIEAKHVSYAYAYDKGGKLAGKLGVSGIPHAFLIDPQGKIVWEGHPGSLSEAVIEKAIVGALAKPLFELPASASGVRSALGKRNYAAALAEARKLGADGAELERAVQGLVSARVQGMKSALEAGDLLGAQEAATALEKELEGLPEANEPGPVLARIEADKDAEKRIAAQKKVRAIGELELGKKGEVEKAIADLRRIAKDLPGSFAARQADELAAALEKRQKAPK